MVSVNKFKETIISFIRSKENSVFAIHDTKGIKLLTRLRLNFSHLNEHKFRHGFKNTVDPMCKCGLETETTLHILLRCRLYSTIRTELLDDIYTAVSSLTNYLDDKLLNILLYGSEYFSVKTNQSIHYSHIFEKFSTLWWPTVFIKSKVRNSNYCCASSLYISFFYPLYVEDVLKAGDDF